MAEIPQRPSGLGWTPDGALLVVSMLDRRLLRFDGAGAHVAADLSEMATGPCNDITPDGRTLIVAEMFASRLTVFAVGADGALSNRRLFDGRIEACGPLLGLAWAPRGRLADRDLA